MAVKKGSGLFFAERPPVLPPAFRKRDLTLFPLLPFPEYVPLLFLGVVEADEAIDQFLVGLVGGRVDGHGRYLRLRIGRACSPGTGGLTRAEQD